MVGMSVTDVSQKAIANPGWTDIKLTHPLFAGDTLYADSGRYFYQMLSNRVFAAMPLEKSNA
jgi:acyl dehydratase